MNFSEGERILCYHTTQLYEARILKSEVWQQSSSHDAGPHYFVHYIGWKQSYDEWVPESRVSVYDQEILNKQRDNKKKKKAGEKKEKDVERPEIKVVIPDALKLHLVDEWENITKNGLLVPLPRNPTVNDILEMYRDSKSGRKSRKEELFNEIIDGIKLYFEKALGNSLLYKFEREQYSLVLQKWKNKSPSDTYGAEHLLRLFVQLPQLIGHTNLDQEAVNALKDSFNDIVKYELYLI